MSLSSFNAFFFFGSEQVKLNNDTAAMDIDESQDVNKRRSKRKSSLRVCYTEPSLNR